MRNSGLVPLNYTFYECDSTREMRKVNKCHIIGVIDFIRSFIFACISCETHELQIFATTKKTFADPTGV